jgi:hypothetical protein
VEEGRIGSISECVAGLMRHADLDRDFGEDSFLGSEAIL